MSIKGEVNELKNINVEIKRVSLYLRNLRQQAKDSEKRIIDYLNEKEQPGLKYEGNAILVENKTKRKIRKKTELQEDALRILRENGVHNASSVLEELMESRKGESVDHQKLKIKKLQEY